MCQFSILSSYFFFQIKTDVDLLYLVISYLISTRIMQCKIIYKRNYDDCFSCNNEKTSVCFTDCSPQYFNWTPERTCAYIDNTVTAIGSTVQTLLKLICMFCS